MQAPDVRLSVCVVNWGNFHKMSILAWPVSILAFAADLIGNLR